MESAEHLLKCKPRTMFHGPHVMTANTHHHLPKRLMGMPLLHLQLLPCADQLRARQFSCLRTWSGMPPRAKSHPAVQVALDMVVCICPAKYTRYLLAHAIPLLIKLLLIPQYPNSNFSMKPLSTPHVSVLNLATPCSDLPDVWLIVFKHT